MKIAAKFRGDLTETGGTRGALGPFSDRSVVFISPEGVTRQNEAILAERSLQLILNGQSLVNLLCTPEHVEELVYGFLFSAGVIESIGEVTDLFVDEDRVSVYLAREIKGGKWLTPSLTSGCGQGISFFQTRLLSEVNSSGVIPYQSILQLMLSLQKEATLYHRTRGAHGAALASPEGITLFREDVGRHNAVDKLVGAALLQSLSLKDKLILTTGRISSEIITKTIRLQVPILVSRSVPTDQAILLGERYKITIVGYVRANSLRIYTHPERISY